MDQILLEYTDKDTQYYNVDNIVSKLYTHIFPKLLPLELQYLNNKKDLMDNSIKRTLETNISPLHFFPLENPVTLYCEIQLPLRIKDIETPCRTYTPAVTINNIDNINNNNTVMIIRVQPGTILFKLSDIDLGSEKSEIILDKGGTFYINEYIDRLDILKVTYFPKQHCATLYPQLSYETLLKSSCNVLPSLFMERSNSLADKDKLELKYIEDIKACKILNTMILERNPETSIRVLTYNVHEWMNRSEENTQEECIRTIIEINPDIVCLQEVTEQLPEELLLTYPYNYVINSEPYADYTLYMTILSKHPIIYAEKISLQSYDLSHIKESRDCIHCAIDYNDRKIHVYNIHLSLDFDIAIKQINDIYNIIKNRVNTPIIIAGDFNHIDSNNYTWYELEFLNKNNIYKKTPLNLYTDIRRVMKIDEAPENFNKIRYTVWSSRAVDFIFPNMGIFSYIYSGFYYTTASDHLPYFMDLSL